MDCPHDSLRVGGLCYFCCKLAAGLIGYGNNHAPKLTAEQRVFVGVVNPNVTGATWVEIPDLLGQLIAQLPVERWETGPLDF